MTDPDNIVATNGETVDLNRLTDAVVDTNEQLDESASTFETVQVKAVPSQVSEEDLVRLEGRVDNPSLKISVQSDVNISATRSLRADRVRYPAGSGEIFEIATVETQTNPFTGVEKQTAVLKALPGRVDLDEV